MNKVISIQQQMNEWGRHHLPFIFCIDFEIEKPLCWLWNEAADHFLFNFNGVTNNPDNSESLIQSFPFVMEKKPKPFTHYKKQFDEVQKEIAIGNSFLINLTSCTKIEINYSLAEMYALVQSKYTCWLKDEFICFSPETFVKIKDNKIYAYPMKGTINASLPNAKDILLNNQKEIDEHATMVDLIRNDLSKVSKHVNVNRYRYYEEIKTNNGKIGQVSSEIMGELNSQFNEKIGDIIFDLLPAGSVSGAPKQKTVDIIAKVEKEKRGYYTGIAGYFDGENLDSTVLIRYLQNDLHYRSGGGITSNSNAMSEYQEMIDKVYVPIF